MGSERADVPVWITAVHLAFVGFTVWMAHYPALFIGGFRDVYAFYQFDTGQKVLRYKSKPEDEWHVYTPINSESERARFYFETLGAKVGK